MEWIRVNEKRFNFVGGYLYDGNDPIGHVEDIKFRQDFEDIVNNLHEKNQELIKDNLQALALLGDVRALLRMNDTERAIKKINKFEKELFKWDIV